MEPSRRWQPYRAPASQDVSSIVGDLRVLPGLPGPPQSPDRDILVHLPAGAMSSGRRYPVLYMHDGQNLFDAATSFSGEWQVDETLALLEAEGLELIVVGIPNAGDGRYAEYTPYKGRRPGFTGGLGRAYLRWVAVVVKPEVDAAFPTLSGRETTGIMGSSLGGLISLWAAVAHPATFGLIGSVSTAVTPGQNEIIRRLARLPVPPLRAYLDVGGHEASDAPNPGLERRWSKAMIRESWQIRDSLVASGLREGETVRLVEDPDAVHHEAHWARRLPDALRFLFGPISV